MNEQAEQKINFYEMWSSIYTLEALLETSSERALRNGNPKLWRILWDDASATITRYLRRSVNTVPDEETLAGELLAAERTRLDKEITKLTIFSEEAGEAMWKNSASIYMVSTTIRHLIQALRAYLEQERRLMMPRKGAAA